MRKSRNNPLFSVGTSYTVDAETGEAVPIEGGGFRMLPGPPGSCPLCHVKHAADHPHDQGSLSYQMKFQQLNGRAATWTDAMAHCSKKMRAMWRAELVRVMRENGLEIPEDLR